MIDSIPQDKEILMLEPSEASHSSHDMPIETPNGSSRLTSPRAIKSALIFAVAGVALYGAATLASDYHAVMASLMKFPLDTLALVVALVFIGWLLRGWRFFYYLRQADEAVPLGYSLSAFLAGFALTGTPAKLGEAVKGVFLKQDYGVPVTRVVGIVMIERLMDLWGVLLLGSLSLMMFRGWRGLFLLTGLAVVAGGAFLSMERLYRPVLERLGRISSLSWVSEKVLGILLTGRDLMTPRIFAVGLVVSAVAWGMEAISLYLILEALQLPVTILQANFVYCFSTILGAVSMLPGGIGGTEAGMIGLLAFLGISYANGLPAVILIRLSTLWLAVLVGLGFMAYMLARRRPINTGPATVRSDVLSPHERIAGGDTR
jgi:glycosyltransferase 2 family protein